MTTSSAVDKEKVEKRRALGRGLDSLLPGPRAVPAAVPAHPVAQNATRAGQPTPAAGPAVSEGVVPEAATVELRPAGRSNGSVPTQAAETDAVDMPAPTDVADDDQSPIEIIAMADPGRMPGNLVVNLHISDIDKNPFQTRYIADDDKLEELADSIKANGVLQPIMVRPSDEDESRYVLIIGERRLHASKKAGKDTIPAMVRKVSHQQAAEMTIVENLQRDDLSPLEQAQAFKVLSQEFNLTQQQIAERVGLSRQSVANYMRLLKLPREVMELLAEKRISFAQAREMLRLEDNDRIAEAALYAVKKGLTVEQIETLVLRMDGMLDPIPGLPGMPPQEKKSGGARWVDPNVRAAQVDLERLLGVRVKIRDRKGKGRIVIEYANVDDYERVVGMLRGKS